MTRADLIKELKLDEKQFKDTLDQVEVAIAHVDLDGQFIKVNRCFCDITGYSEQEILKSTYHDITYSDDIYTQYQIRKRILDGEDSSYKTEKRYIKKDDSIIWVSLTETLIRESDGEPHYFISIIDDITDRKKAEEDVRNLTRAIEQSSSAIVIADIEGNIKYVNSRFSQLTGYAREEVIGQNPRIFKSNETPSEIYKELWKALTSGNEWRGEFCNRKKSGELYYEFTSISPVKDDKGVVMSFIAVKDDITEKKKMQDALLQSEKLKIIETIASGVSHEFNNILSTISDNIPLLEDASKEHEELTDRLCSIKMAADDGVELSRSMLDFARTTEDATGYSSCDIRDLIKQSIDSTMPKWRNMAKAKGINYHLKSSAVCEVPAILCNPTKLRLVFVNIINNALDAMPEGGTIGFCTWFSGDTVFVTISDTGEGMTEEVMKYVFDPFITTKDFLGSGLGMSTAYGIITGHGGKMEVESEIGKGSIFSIQLPVSTEVDCAERSLGREQK